MERFEEISPQIVDFLNDKGLGRAWSSEKVRMKEKSGTPKGTK